MIALNWRCEEGLGAFLDRLRDLAHLGRALVRAEHPTHQEEPDPDAEKSRNESDNQPCLLGAVQDEALIAPFGSEEVVGHVLTGSLRGNDSGRRWRPATPVYRTRAADHAFGERRMTIQIRRSLQQGRSPGARSEDGYVGSWVCQRRIRSGVAASRRPPRPPGLQELVVGVEHRRAACSTPRPSPRRPVSLPAGGRGPACAPGKRAGSTRSRPTSVHSRLAVPVRVGTLTEWTRPATLTRWRHWTSLIGMVPCDLRDASVNSAPAARAFALERRRGLRPRRGLWARRLHHPAQPAYPPDPGERTEAPRQLVRARSSRSRGRGCSRPPRSGPRCGRGGAGASPR